MILSKTDDQLIWSASWDQTIKIHDIINNKLIAQMGSTVHNDKIDIIQLSGDGLYAASGDSFGFLGIWNAINYNLIFKKSLAHDNKISDILFDANNSSKF